MCLVIVLRTTHIKVASSQNATGHNLCTCMVVQWLAASPYIAGPLHHPCSRLCGRETPKIVILNEMLRGSEQQEDDGWVEVVDKKSVVATGGKQVTELM